MGVFLEGNDVDLEGNKLGKKWYTEKQVSPLMGSEAPCCGGGLSGIYLLIIHFIFSILTTVPPSPIFSKFPMFFQHYPPCLIFKHSKNHRKILQRLLNQGLQNGKYFFD